jgi:CHAD domain-containing protein
MSRFERGLQAAGLTPSVGASEAPPPGREDPLLRLAYHHLGAQMTLLKCQQPRAWEGLDPDGVHQMRVATRRIRAALRVFKPILPPRTVASFNSQFRWLASALGEVRDLDVYRDDLVRYMEAIPPDDAQSLAPYHRYLVGEAQKARRRLVGVLGSRRYARLIERFERFVVRGPSRTALRRFGMSVADCAAANVDRRLKTVLKHARGVRREPNAQSLHALRIRCKRLRYTMEFFAGVCPDPLDKAIDATSRLQDLLGEHQDAWVASERLRTYANSVPVRSNNRALLLSLGQLIQTQEQHASARRTRFREEWRRFKKRVSRKSLRAELRTVAQRDAPKA